MSVEMKDKIQALRQKHIVMNRPYLALIVMPLWACLIKNLVGMPDIAISVEWPVYKVGVFAILGAFMCLKLHRKWFSSDYKGNLLGRNTLYGLLLLLPSMIFVVLNLLGIKNMKETSFITILMSVIAGATPGVFEEVAFRGLAGSNFMRFFHDGKKIRIAAILTGVIFGGVHIVNLIKGAALSSTFTQVLYAIGLGILFAAVFFRTGTLWPTIIVHSLIDISHYVVHSSGVLSSETPTAQIIMLSAFAVVYAGWGLYLLRDSKVPEINAIWKDIWGSDYVEEGKPAPAE